MQQRALMLKRLAFAVFSSEPDQYESSLPIVQERLAECLRMPQVPVIHEQVFLFFRVLLVCMSNQLTFIWPMIISEMIHVFLLMESDLLQSDTPSRDQQMFYSETVLGASGYVNYSQEKWLGLYLSVCKLLDMALCLPPEQLPQFQMYRWAFEGSGGPDGHVTNLVTAFTPYVNRITKLLAKRKNIYVSGKPLECHAGRPLLTMYQLESVDELLPFLRLLSTEGRIIVDLRCGEKGKSRKPKGGASKNFIERLIERDFLEPMKE